MNDVGTRQALPVLGDEAIGRGRARPAAGRRARRGGTLVTERGNLPLEALSVHARITGLLAEVVLTQTFVNRFDPPVAGHHICALPDRAAVTDFRMEAGDRSWRRPPGGSPGAPRRYRRRGALARQRRGGAWRRGALALDWHEC